MNLAADSDRALEVSPQIVLIQYKNLVKETGALFGSRHYRDYHFLFTLSDHVAHFGLEHHESSDDRYAKRTLVDPDIQRISADLLSHEFVHSWNGKFRRPAGLTSGGKDGGYETPMKGDLLWVYEGLTQYLGEILAPRSGLRTAEDFRDSLAMTAADLDNKFGRTWRPSADTAVAAQILYYAGGDYDNYRRNVDYYAGGHADLAGGGRDHPATQQGRQIAERFLPGVPWRAEGGAPALKTYEFGDVVAALNAVQPYDWATYLNERLQSTSRPRAPLGGMSRNRAGELTYDAVRGRIIGKVLEGQQKRADLSYSIGLKVQEDGSIADVQIGGGAAQKAGVAPSTKVMAVNNREFSLTVLREAVAKTATDSKPIELLIKTGEYFETHRIEYQGGERYPHSDPRFVQAGPARLTSSRPTRNKRSRWMP